MNLPRIYNVWTSERSPEVTFVEFPCYVEGRLVSAVFVAYEGRIVHSDPLTF